nr:hypothetical protein [Tanacetum cinerariifolium]
MPMDAGINFTNLSDTKDAASQEVKKDVSSLRYIALPNWVHDALLESSSSKPQDDCSTDVPESSGNSNSTATLTNPPADQLETLTMETLIPTVSSSVLTACLNGSLEPSSDTRLVSKRVANQVKTPSLDNILTLINRFKDILGVTKNTVDLDGVEAYVSNMETTITASPTPTLRIHKDHPKSQIISHVDTSIQTRNKSKEDPKFPAKVYKVEKAMYGLHQAPRAWYGTLSKYLLTNGFQRDVRSSNTPMDKENSWGKDGTGKDVDLHLYRSMIGSLMYLTASRPDIMFAVCAYARHYVTPKECHLHAVKRIFRYLKGHPKLGLWFPKESPFDLTIVATSTTETEYVAATSCCGQVLWIQNQLLDYGDCFEKKLISVDHIHTDENVADLLKKPFNARRFQYLVESCPVYDIDNEEEESMPVYDTDVEDVIEEEEDLLGKEDLVEKKTT